MAVTQRLKFNSYKKHSVRYDKIAGEEEPALTAVYISKKRLPSAAPLEITITIDWKEEG